MIKPFSVVALILDEEQNVLSISRRNAHEDIGLPGGKVEPTDLDGYEAVRREVLEEVGVEVAREDLQHIYTRSDSEGRCVFTDNKICYCYFVLKYKGRPRAIENGFKVRGVTFLELLDEKNTFSSYNRGLHTHLALNPLPAPYSVRVE